MEYTRYRLDPRLSSVLGRLSTSKFPEAGQQLMDKLPQLVGAAAPTPTGDALERALAPFRWFLERGEGQGLALTQAGYLKPADVKQVAALLPTMSDWIFPVTREVNTLPVLEFRDRVQRMGLLRKRKGALLTTRLGRSLSHPSALWDHVVESLIPEGHDFDTDASVLIAVHFAAEPGRRVDPYGIATTLGQLGWAREGGFPVQADDLHWRINEVWHLLGNIGPSAGSRRERTPSPEAVALVRDALVTETFTQSSETAHLTNFRENP